MTTIVENCVGKLVCKIRLKNLVGEFGGKVVLKNVWNNIIGNCVEKLYDKFNVIFLKQIVVIFFLVK